MELILTSSKPENTPEKERTKLLAHAEKCWVLPPGALPSGGNCVELAPEVFERREFDAKLQIQYRWFISGSLDFCELQSNKEEDQKVKVDYFLSQDMYKKRIKLFSNFIEASMIEVLPHNYL